jgi:formylglycine-generating enzyme required for sulfatase activity
MGDNNIHFRCGDRMIFIRYSLLALFMVIIACGPKPQNTTKLIEIQGIKLVLISKERFTMGDGESKLIDEKPAHDIELDPFYMSESEITNAQYTDFLNSALISKKIIIINIKNSPQVTVYGETWPFYKKALIYWINSKGAEGKPSWLIYESGSFGVVKGKENLPVVAVTWYGACAFAQNYGLRLPTEAEWECAARGGNSLSFSSPEITGMDINCENKVDSPAPVMKYPANSFKLYEMSGNVQEWCLDEYDRVYYRSSPPKNPSNTTNSASPAERVVRGGSYDSKKSDCRCAARFHLPPDTFDCRTGFRVVMQKI